MAGKRKRNAAGRAIEASGWPNRLVVDVAGPEFEPAAIDSSRYGQGFRPDTQIDAWSSDRFSVRAACVRGDDHRFRGIPRQDDFAVGLHQKTGSVVVAVADGVSAARLSSLGSSAACRYAVDGLLRQLEDGGPIEWQAILKGAAWAVVETAQRATGSPEPDPAAAEDLCGTTLCAVVLTPIEGGASAEGISSGDSGMLRLAGGRLERMVGGRETEDEVYSPAVVALPRIPEETAPITFELRGGEALLVVTDGLMDPLGGGTGPLGRLFVQLLAGVPQPLELCRLVDFSRETFDDDRTLVAVWPRLPDDPLSQAMAKRGALRRSPAPEAPIGGSPASAG